MTDFSIFDYSQCILDLQDKISIYNTNIDSMTNQLNILQAASEYNSVVQSTINHLTALKSSFQTNLADTEAVLQEINKLLAETEENKATLYYYYTIVTTDKATYMTKMLFNYENALADPTISTLMTDQVTPLDTKTLIANIIYNSVSINNKYSYILSSLNL
jgi:hypothetical protein